MRQKETFVTLTTDQLGSVTSGNVVNASGDKIGGVGQIYLDDETGQPNWVTVKTGLFGTSESFVPLADASVSGNDIVVNYDKDTVKNAPRVDPDGHLSPNEEEELYRYYGLSGGGSYDQGADDRGADYDRGADRGADDRGADYDRGADLGADDRGADATVGHDTSGPSTDDAMTLSEERVNVGTQTREAGRARLRKYVVTENVTQTVPVSREEVRVEREPITEANRGDAYSGPAISEEEHEVVLHEERPVVEKEAVPTERVRLDTETVTDEVTVNEEVRKEEIDTDVDTDVGRRTDTGTGRDRI
jgi:uncharacterized protein (TIGR02271 family)